MNLNRLGVAHNYYQRMDEFKRVLTVCSAGCLRSPTAAVVLAMSPYNFNTRAAGCTEEYAIILVDEILIAWADEIVFMEQNHKDAVADSLDISGKSTIVLDIPDRFSYRDPDLMAMIRERYDMATEGQT